MSRTYSTRCPKCEENGKDSRGDNLIVWPDGSTHCFACGRHTYPKHYVVKEKENVPKSLLPFDFTREVPAAAWKWLLQYSLPLSYWKECVGYSPSTHRLIFKVGNPLAFSIGRFIQECVHPVEGSRDVSDYPLQQRGGSVVQRVKGNTKWFVWGDCHRHAEVINPNEGESIILVEDLISGHKVGQLTTTIPLFGTAVHNPVMYYLMNDLRPVKLWLDKDQEGNVKKTAIRLQTILNKPVDIIITDNDPKLLTTQQIKELI
jgi:hypothetical protein